MAERPVSLAGLRLRCLGLLLAMTIALSPGASRAEQATGVSMIALIANPDRYDGKLVRIIGFLRIEFEGNAVYLHRSDYEHAISKNGLWTEIDMARKDLDKKYVLIEGTFEADNHGHMGMFSGAITNIRRAQLWSDPEKPVTKQ